MGVSTRRRIVLLGVVTALAAGLALWASRDVELALSRGHPVIGRLLIPAARASAVGTEIAGAASLLDLPDRAGRTRSDLQSAFTRSANGKGETLDFGLGVDDEPEFAPRTQARVPLPATASALLRAQDNPLLILHTGEPARLAKVGARRGWLGPLAADVFASAQAISLAVSEDTEGGWMHVTLALEFADGESAEVALRRLTAAEGDFGQLGFVAQPGYERVVRRTRLVVIRLDARVDSVARQLRTR